jgi:hypothetical protein
MARFVEICIIFAEKIRNTMLIGRKEELQKIRQAYNSEYSEFIAVYGRRRVGKTFLIREAFDYKFTFTYTGRYNSTAKQQLASFYASLKKQGCNAESEPKNWVEAFDLLEKLLEASSDKRKVVFLDELPWMDSPRSGFVSALEYFWNAWATARKDILLIISGSASSWIIKEIFRNKGGLHNRVTYRMALKPFSLNEVEQYVEANNLGFSRNQIIEGYMVMGGIPYYWSKLSADKSMAQNINDLFFKEEGEFHYEFNELYQSIFNRPEKYISVIEALATKKKGLTRDEIIRVAKLDSSGKLTNIIDNLTQCGFIRKYCAPGKRVRDVVYQLIDCYTIFYYQFIKNASGADEEYWTKLQNTAAYHSWCGVAFERVCMLHSRQIKAALGISGIMANVYSWQTDKTEYHPGVQIDMLIDRADNVVDLCEMKYAPDGYTMTAAEAEKINTRSRVLSQYLPAKKSIRVVLITSNGLNGNIGSAYIQKQLTATDLFLP